MRLWNIETGKEIKQFTPKFGTMHGVSFSPDGKRLAAGGSNGQIRVWEVETGKELMTYTGHQAKVDELRFTPDGKRIVSVGEDRLLRVWLAPR